MTKTKIILITVALFLLIMAVVGFSFVQYVNTQSQNTTFNQTHKVTLETVDSWHSGYGCSQVLQQGAYPYRTGMEMGMMGRFW
jgi:predicted PurR-regulated permease PerM